jgi:arylsulfatase A-like enzyme
LNYTDLYAKKWVSVESRGAVALDDAFLGWLDRQRRGRPFFAFLNYFDAHQPYMAPAGYDGRFGIRPGKSRDYEFLTTFAGSNHQELRLRDIDMARDCYDNCIAFLDAELGRLLQELETRKLLESTDIIIMSDHGEEFAEHGLIGHGNGVMLNEVGVPLVIISPRCVPGRVVNSAVSLRDLPATVVDLLGLSEGSPFPGRSLAAYWRTDKTPVRLETSPGFTEQVSEEAFKSQSPSTHEHLAMQMSLVALGYHYIRRSAGIEQLYHLSSDPYEQVDLSKDPEGQRQLATFRKMLLEILAESPATTEMDAAYLKSYRQRLKELVAGPNPSTASRTKTARLKPDLYEN